VASAGHKQTLVGVSPIVSTAPRQLLSVLWL